jgi:glutathionyl-hydroquinone reductase
MQDLHQTMQIFSQARHPTKTPEINGTETPHTIKRGYYSIKALNPTGIVPLGPECSLG